MNNSLNTGLETFFIMRKNRSHLPTKAEPGRCAMLISGEGPIISSAVYERIDDDEVIKLVTWCFI